MNEGNVLMKAMVLAAGQGSRLYPLTANRPKPVVPVAGVPLLAHICDLLRESGIHDVVINCHHEADVLREYLDDLNLDMNIQVSEEADLLGTAGGVKHAQDYLSDTFVVVYGDNLFDIDISAVLDFHRRKNALVTVALNRVDHPEECGVVDIDEEGLILGFKEKPRREEVTSNLANAGLYVVEREILDLIPADQPYDFGSELFPALLQTRGRMYGYIMEQGYARDIGTPRNYAAVHRDILEGKVNRLQRRLTPEVSKPVSRNLVASTARVEEGAILDEPVSLGDETQVEVGARITSGSVIGRLCSIHRGALIESSIIWDRVTVGEGARIMRSVVAEDCEIQARVTVSEGCIVGSGCLLEKDSALEPGVRLPPNTVVEEGEIVLRWC